MDQLDLQNARLEAVTAELVQLDGQVKFQQAAGALEDAVQRPIDTIKPSLIEQQPATRAINREKSPFAHHHWCRARWRRRLDKIRHGAAPAAEPPAAAEEADATHITHDTNGCVVVNMSDDTQGDVGIEVAEPEPRNSARNWRGTAGCRTPRLWPRSHGTGHRPRRLRRFQQ